LAWEIENVEDEKESLVQQVQELEATAADEKQQLEGYLKRNHCLMRFLKEHELLCEPDFSTTSELCVSSSSTTFLCDPLDLSSVDGKDTTPASTSSELSS